MLVNTFLTNILGIILHLA